MKRQLQAKKNLFCRLGLRFNLRPQKVTQEDKNQQKRDEWHVAGTGGEHLWWDPKEPPKGLATSGFSFSWELYLEKYRMMQAKAGWWETPYFKKNKKVQNNASGTWGFPKGKLSLPKLWEIGLRKYFRVLGQKFSIYQSQIHFRNPPYTGTPGPL